MELLYSYANGILISATLDDREVSENEFISIRNIYPFINVYMKKNKGNTITFTQKGILTYL